jgi:hypothetical protein
MFGASGCAFADTDAGSSKSTAKTSASASDAAVVTNSKSTASASSSGRILHAVSAVSSARVTFYDPSMDTKMEGGDKDLYGDVVNSIEDSSSNGRPVTLAADRAGAFGNECNRVNQRCLILFHVVGFDQAFPSYHKHFPHLPKDTFLGLVEDTGSDFTHTNGSRFDLASRSSRNADAAPRGLNTNVKWTVIDNPCGDGEAGRRCDFSTASLTSETMAMLDVTVEE